jgi:hypothetical protein
LLSSLKTLSPLPRDLQFAVDLLEMEINLLKERGGERYAPNEIKSCELAVKILNMYSEFGGPIE